MEVLAWALNWPTAVKKLAFRPPDIPVLASFLLDRSASDPIAPPWPNLVLCAEARTSVIARQIRERAGDQVKIVCLGRPAGHPARFDLVLTTAQYRLPKSPQVVELDLPLSARDDAAPHHPVRNDIAALANAPRPLTVALIGGTAPPELLDGETATALARSLLSHVTNTRGTLVAITSPRTGEAARNAIVRMIREPHMVHLWREGADNSYGNLLALADEFVVTGDSVSMAAEALVTGKPVSVYRLPRRRALVDRAAEWLYGLTWGNPNKSSWLKLLEWPLDIGLIEPLPDRSRLFDRLFAEGYLSWFGEPSTAWRRISRGKMIDAATTHIERLFLPSSLR
jgi:uncharacterized protein